MQGLADSHGRRFRYLRLSVTDACNFRCVYCLPNGYRKPAGAQAPLGVSEIRNLVSGFAAMGFWKVRLTGGEPTLRRDIVEIAHEISSIPGIRKVALTTNGYRLAQLAGPLRAAGVNALNVSIDSLNAERFRKITGQNRLHDVLKGIDAAFSSGFSAIKVNAVLMKGHNDLDLDSYLEWIRRAPISVRFIELMRTGDNRKLFEGRHLSAGTIQLKLLAWGWSMRHRSEGDGPAVEFEHPEYVGRIGLIAPYSRDFCRSCNRLRVSSQGDLRLCLFGEEGHPLRHLLRFEHQRDELIAAVRELIGEKAAAHYLHDGKYGNTQDFAAIGG